MKVIHKHNASVKEDDACTITEYKIDEQHAIDCAIAKVNGRYPSSGSVINEHCKELAYVFEGGGKLVVEHKEVVLNAGDCVLIEPQEKYYWSGHMTLFISCTPEWHVEQHKIVISSPNKKQFNSENRNGKG